MELTFPVILAKWLKKAKLRDGSHSVGLTGEGTFFYRGFPLGFVRENSVILKWPATTEKSSGMWSQEEELQLADPKFFQKMRKAFRGAMTMINAVAVNTKKTAARRRSQTKQ
jgi:hypothetical protein